MCKSCLRDRERQTERCANIESLRERQTARERHICAARV